MSNNNDNDMECTQFTPIVFGVHTVSTTDREPCQLFAKSMSNDPERRVDFSAYMCPASVSQSTSKITVNAAIEISEGSVILRGEHRGTVSVTRGLTEFLKWLEEFPEKVVLLWHQCSPGDSSVDLANAVQGCYLWETFKVKVAGFVNTRPLIEEMYSSLDFEYKKVCQVRKVFTFPGLAFKNGGADSRDNVRHLLSVLNALEVTRQHIERHVCWTQDVEKSLFVAAASSRTKSKRLKTSSSTSVQKKMAPTSCQSPAKVPKESKGKNIPGKNLRKCSRPQGGAVTRQGSKTTRNLSKTRERWHSSTSTSEVLDLGPPHKPPRKELVGSISRRKVYNEPSEENISSRIESESHDRPTSAPDVIILSSDSEGDELSGSMGPIEIKTEEDIEHEVPENLSEPESEGRHRPTCVPDVIVLSSDSEADELPGSTHSMAIEIKMEDDAEEVFPEKQTTSSHSRSESDPDIEKPRQRDRQKKGRSMQAARLSYSSGEEESAGNTRDKEIRGSPRPSSTPGRDRSKLKLPRKPRADPKKRFTVDGDRETPQVTSAKNVSAGGGIVVVEAGDADRRADDSDMSSELTISGENRDNTPEPTTSSHPVKTPVILSLIVAPPAGERPPEIRTITATLYEPEIFTWHMRTPGDQNGPRRPIQEGLQQLLEWLSWLNSPFLVMHDSGGVYRLLKQATLGCGLYDQYRECVLGLVDPLPLLQRLCPDTAPADVNDAWKLMRILRRLKVQNEQLLGVLQRFEEIDTGVNGDQLLNNLNDVNAADGGQYSSEEVVSDSEDEDNQPHIGESEDKAAEDTQPSIRTQTPEPPMRRWSSSSSDGSSVDDVDLPSSRQPGNPSASMEIYEFDEGDPQPSTSATPRRLLKKTGTRVRTREPLRPHRVPPPTLPSPAPIAPGEYTWVVFDMLTTVLGEHVEMYQLSAVKGEDHLFNQYFRPPHRLEISKRNTVTLTGARVEHEGSPVSSATYKEGLDRFLLWLQQFEAPVLVAHELHRSKSSSLVGYFERCGLLDKLEHTVKGFADSQSLARKLRPTFHSYSMVALVKAVVGVRYDPPDDSRQNAKQLQKVLDRLNVSHQQMRASTCSVQCMAFAMRTRRNGQTLKPLVEMNVLSGYMSRKVSLSGLQLDDLRSAFQAGDIQGLADLLGEKIRGKARVTNHMPTIRKLAAYFHGQRIGPQ